MAALVTTKEVATMIIFVTARRADKYFTLAIPEQQIYSIFQQGNLIQIRYNNGGMDFESSYSRQHRENHGAQQPFDAPCPPPSRQPSPAP